jgi:hypothetical protein
MLETKIFRLILCQCIVVTFYSVSSVAENSELQNLIDPTIRVAKTGDPIVKAITISPNRAFCFISYQGQNQMFVKNDKFDVYSVLEITHSYVMLIDQNNKKLKLTVY